MIFAPVIIPTLNRKTHLENLLYSLENNPWAKFTEVFISVDYPPSDKYLSGYNEVCAFLDNFENTNNFKSLIVIKQEKNLGPFENSKFLEQIISEKYGYDRWIYTEDDNVFAPNFLEYIDKGLDLFDKDEDVMAICGFHDLTKDFGKKFNLKDNVVKQLCHVPYGYGILKKNNDIFYKEKEEVLLGHKYDNIFNIFRLFRTNKLLFTVYVRNILCGNKVPEWVSGELQNTDCIRGIYNFFKNKCCIIPVIYKSHSEGFDGSGFNMAARNINPNEAWPLDSELSFDFIYETPFLVKKEIIKELDLQTKYNFLSLIKTWILYFIYLRCKKNRCQTLNFLSSIRNR